MLELLLTTKDIGSIPPALDGVPVGGLDRLRGVRPRCLLILGADDASLPSLPDGGGLFSEDEGAGVRLGHKARF
jgi:ATP-dependent helicase/DNAse subunit B